MLVVLFCGGPKLIGGQKLIFRKQQKTNLAGMNRPLKKMIWREQRTGALTSCGCALGLGQTERRRDAKADREKESTYVETQRVGQTHRDTS